MKPSDSTRTLRLAHTGISNQEEAILSTIVSGQNITLHKANSDLDLWKKTFHEQFDVYLIGQNSQLKKPSHLVWFLQDMVSPLKVITLYSKLEKDEACRLLEYQVPYVLMRPLEQPQFLPVIQTIRQQPVRTKRRDRAGSWVYFFQELFVDCHQ